jgi:hypothetical protein
MKKVAEFPPEVIDSFTGAVHNKEGVARGQISSRGDLRGERWRECYKRGNSCFGTNACYF